MAYGVMLASIHESQIEDFRARRIADLSIIDRFTCSHLLAYWIPVQPLGRLLEEALDGGEELRADLRHPYRVPMYHPPLWTKVLAEQLRAEWAKGLQGGLGAKELSYFGSEIPGVVSLFENASLRGLGIVSILDPVVDPATPNLKYS